MRFEEEAEMLFGKMREATKGEQECINKHLKDISEPTVVNLLDYLDKPDEKSIQWNRNMEIGDL